MPDEFHYDVSLSHSAKDKAVVRPSRSLSASIGERARVRCRNRHSPERLRTCRAEAAGRRRKDGPEHGRSEILHSSFYLLRFPKGCPGTIPSFPLLDLSGKPGKNSTMNSATISTKGQLVIPNRFRKALHLQAGQKVTFSLEGEKLVLQREQPKRARLVRGKFGRPVLVAPPGAPPMTPDRVKAILNELP